MIRRSRAPLIALAFLTAAVAPAAAQKPLEMKIYLGPNRELEVDAIYHDPAVIDARLNKTRVIPMFVTVRNSSRARLPLAYRDVRLDLGGDTGLTRLAPISPDTAVATLRKDGQYNAFLSFLGSQTDQFSKIDPFEKVFSDAPLDPGRRKEGFVFFLGPLRELPATFLALGTESFAPQILKTDVVQVMSPDSDGASMWPAMLNTWPARFSANAKELRAAIGNVMHEIANGAPPYRKSYALVMGVSDYKYLDTLPKVRNDLDKMSSLLRGLGFTVVRIDNEKLTLANIRSPQEFFANVANIGPEDRLLVFFAGHGFQRAEGGKTRGYLALINGQTSDRDTKNTIAMDDFVLWTEKVAAKHLLVLLESCFSGLAVRGRPVDVQMMGAGEAPHGPPDPQALYQLSKDPGRYLVMAGDENQRVPMGDAWGGGLFADAVIKGLSGRADGDKDGFVTARELYPWLRRYVETEAMKVLHSTVTPLIKDLDPVLSKGEFVFTISP
jgi:hypothetical protein